MRLLVLLGLLAILCVVNLIYCNKTEKFPDVVISVIARNQKDSLPLFLTLINEFDYPKSNIVIWIHSDYNEDSSIEIIDAWSKKHFSEYKKMHLSLDRTTSGKKLDDQSNSAEWTQERFKHVIRLRERALKFAKDSWADYIFMLDADVFLTNPECLKLLVGKNLPVVAPMLITDGLYSNFWGDMSVDFYYKRSENYEDIVHRSSVGCFEVPMVHSAVLIDLRAEMSDFLTYDPTRLKGIKAPIDDIITFALSAKQHVCNDEIYGFVPIPVDALVTSEKDQVDNVVLEALGRGIDLPLEKCLEDYISLPPKTKLGLNEIFLINLEKRPQRLKLMLKSFDTLGLQVKLVKAVDGNKMTKEELDSVKLMPNYEDPYHKRPMKTGEIGCFHSHFSIWTEIAKRNLKASLVLEDDIHFVPYFRRRFDQLLNELEKIDWDLVYIGRKVLMDKDEEFVSAHVTKPRYSYWTLGYLLSENGARKLINAEPLAKMLPVDEFLPIMFDQHPNSTWKSMFANRHLKAFSASPLLVHPTHYTGEDGYISDTENSPPVTAPRSLAENTKHGKREVEEL